MYNIYKSFYRPFSFSLKSAKRNWETCAVQVPFFDVCVRNGMATSAEAGSKLYRLAQKINCFYLFGE